VTSFVSLGRVTATPPAPPAARWIPWGTATEPPDAPGLTALTCAALFGVGAYRVGHRCSAVSVHSTVTRDLLNTRLREVDLGALRHTLVTQRAHRMNDRGWLVQRALHRVAWGEACVDALPSAAAAAAITNQQIVEHAHDVTELIHTEVKPDERLDALTWRGGLYYGARDVQRLAVGVQLPWTGRNAGAESALIAATYLGRVGAPGSLVQTLTRRQVPYYAAAATPVQEHGTACLSIGLSTVADHVVALLEAVRDELRRIRGFGIPDAQLPYLQASARLYEAIHPSEDPFQFRAGDPAGPVGLSAPAVAVVGQLPEATVTQLREVVREW
jgi:hypothetical protein